MAECHREAQVATIANVRRRRKKRLEWSLRSHLMRWEKTRGHRMRKAALRLYPRMPTIPEEAVDELGRLCDGEDPNGARWLRATGRSYETDQPEIPVGRAYEPNEAAIPRWIFSRSLLCPMKFVEMCTRNSYYITANMFCTVYCKGRMDSCDGILVGFFSAFLDKAVLDQIGDGPFLALQALVKDVVNAASMEFTPKCPTV
ncbi:uncharacterized protein LOC124160117 isoform X2 [Ischnura elegans]|uniref:uncharacterized protein LOC124160117 isoform X2 n=1 Tax=Ischnura elegans TaxID=197161 RepID=UPI001ED869C9|nr:uncharacterized protein LOC124160117 isoform X2 [Ischnura elegans]